MSLSPADFEKSIGTAATENGSCLVYLNGKHLGLQPCGSDGWSLEIRDNLVYVKGSNRLFPPSDHVRSFAETVNESKRLCKIIEKKISEYDKDKTYPPETKPLNHRLWGMRCYLSGSMDREPDHGVYWRERITPFLLDLGVIPLNPCDKPIDIAQEIENREFRNSLKESEDFELLAKLLKPIRLVDLRMVDMAEFLIVRMDSSVHTCGTYEELFWANRMKRPILIWCVGGKKSLPDWLWSVVPEPHIFTSDEEIKQYLLHVHLDENISDLKRWMFFDFTKIVPRISPEESGYRAKKMRKEYYDRAGRES